MKPWQLLVFLLLSDLSPPSDGDWIMDYFRWRLCRKERLKVALQTACLNREYKTMSWVSKTPKDQTLQDIIGAILRTPTSAPVRFLIWLSINVFSSVRLLPSLALCCCSLAAAGRNDQHSRWGRHNITEQPSIPRITPPPTCGEMISTAKLWLIFQLISHGWKWNNTLVLEMKRFESVQAVFPIKKSLVII